MEESSKSKLGHQLRGNINGNSMSKDEATGFLQPNGNWNIRGFTAPVKLEFVNMLTTNPIVSAACRKVGIHYSTFRNHYDIDPEFKKRVDYALNEGNEYQRGEFESAMLTHGKKINGFMWAMAFLRNRFPGAYNETRNVQHNVTMNIQNKLKDLSKVVDIEPVKDNDE